MLSKEEKNAPKEYHRLIKMLKYRGDKELVRSIISDEKKHALILKKIKRREY